jgi:hypothetical protein
MTFNQLLVELLNDLDAIGQAHDEIGDTDVREQMSAAVFDGFIQPRSQFSLPSEFGMFSEVGNRLVRAALEKFLQRAGPVAQAQGIQSDQQRLDAFQAESVQSASGTYYDDYFGWMEELPSK